MNSKFIKTCYTFKGSILTIYWCEYKGLMDLVCVGGEMEWRPC